MGSKNIKNEIKETVIEQKNQTIDILQTIIQLQDSHIKADEIKNKRSFIKFIIFIVAFLINNIVWIYAYNNKEIITETITTTQESAGDSNIINGNHYQDNAVHNQDKDNKEKDNKEKGGN